MAENKTKPTNKSVEEFLNSITEEKKRQDSFAILEMMKEATGETPVMWGDAIVGFGRYHYKYASGHEGDAGLAGFSPRKQNLTIYIGPGFERYGALMQKLGRFTTGKVCLYIKRLSDVDLDVLRELVKQSTEQMRRDYPPDKAG